jgi:hypothetical protein
MASTTPGQLVTLDADGRRLDGIVFDAPSASKVVVAVVDAARGPGFRTVHPRALADRADPAPGDRALRLLIRRTPSPGAGTGPAGPGAARGRSAGHTRAAAHRSPGR